MTQSERENLGKLGAEYVRKNYNFKDFNERWVNLMLNVHEERGSWENRKNYQAWEFIEL